MRHKLRMTTILLAITISFTIMYFYSMSHNKTNDIFIEQTKINVLRLKKDFLKDTVNNVIFQTASKSKLLYNLLKMLNSAIFQTIHRFLILLEFHPQVISIESPYY